MLICDLHKILFTIDFQSLSNPNSFLFKLLYIILGLQLLAGPTSFAPMVEAAIDIVERSGGQYHVLVIIADGQVRVKTYLFFIYFFSYIT